MSISCNAEMPNWLSKLSVESPRSNEAAVFPFPKALAELGPVEHVTTEVLRRKRIALVKAVVLDRANGVCECCSEPAPFQRPQGIPYLEVHHLDRLADDGADHPANAGAVCPTCHRRIHFGLDGQGFNDKLRGIVGKLEGL